jgi:twinkle protein
MKKFIKWEDLNFKKHNGVEALRCPACDDIRSDKTNKSLKVKHNEGFGNCFYCEAYTIRDIQENNVKKDYSLPSQEWRNYTELPDKLVQWVWKERMISQTTLIHFGITQEEVYFPQIQKKQNSIVFNYFEGETVVNKKYRGVIKQGNEIKKAFTQHTGGKPIFYNINSIIGQEEVYIVEGEFDVLAMYEVGIKNVISLPNGANDNDDFWINSERYLRDVKKFIIATDNDDKGILVREKIAQRLGRYRCVYLSFDRKDANDDLKAGELLKTIKKEHRFNIGGTFTSFDLLDETFRLYHQGMPETIKPKSEMFKGFNEIFSIMMGQLTVVTGIPSHGKSSFVDWYALNLVKDYDYKLSIYSPEHTPLGLYNSKYATLTIGKPFWGYERMSENEFLQYTEWSKEKLYYTTSEESVTPDWDWLLDKFKEQMFTYGINMFIIDAWNKVLMPKGMTGKDGIDQILTRITSFCVQYNVHIFLVAHPTKMKRDEKTGAYEVPDLYSVSGSADFRNQTHNGLCVHREFGNVNEDGYTMVYNLKTKYDFQGTITAGCKFNWNNRNRRFYTDGSESDFNLINNTIHKTKTEEQEVNFLNLKPNEEFDCPF